MREILFRGKTSSGEWVYGSYAKVTHSMMNGRNPHKSWIISGFAANGGWIAPLGIYAVNEDTVGQYTGLEDRNGIKIFEGDIMELYGGSVAYVRYCEDCYTVFDKDGFICDLSDILETPCAVVIGNVYENPELLKGDGAKYETEK